MYEKIYIFCSDAGYLWWSHAGALWDLQDLSKIKIPLQSRSSRTGSQIAAHLVQQVKHCVPLCLRWIKTPCVLQSKKKNTNNPVHDDFWLMTACIFSCSLKQKYCDRFCLKAASGLTNHRIQLKPEKHAYICTHVREYIYICLNISEDGTAIEKCWTDAVFWLKWERHSPKTANGPVHVIG